VSIDGYYQDLETDSYRSRRPENPFAVRGSTPARSKSLAAAFSTLEDTSSSGPATANIEGDTDEVYVKSYTRYTTPPCMHR